MLELIDLRCAVVVILFFGFGTGRLLVLSERNMWLANVVTIDGLAPLLYVELTRELTNFSFS